MAWKSRLLRALDRPGSRALLSALTTRLGRRVTGDDVEVFFDEVWVHRVGDVYVPDSARWHYNRARFQRWAPSLRAAADETRENWYFAYEPRPGDVIVDVGAGASLDVLHFSRAVGVAGSVLAIEAQPDSFRLLRKLCEYNDLCNVTCVHRAVADRAGRIEMHGAEGSRASRVETGFSRPEAAEAVPCDTLDAICAAAGVGAIDLLKMNIEGAERLAILGMTDVIRRTRVASIACHDFLAESDEFYRTRELVRAFLEAEGFDVRTRHDHERPWVRDHLHAVRRAPTSGTTPGR